MAGQERPLLARRVPRRTRETQRKDSCRKKVALIAEELSVDPSSERQTFASRGQR